MTRQMNIEVVSSAFGDLTIVEQLRPGGQGWVFKARTQDGQDVALKIFDQTTNLAQRIDHEVDALRQLDSPYIVSLIDEGSRMIGQSEHRYTITQFIDGIDLRRRLDEGPLSSTQARSLCRRMACAIRDLWNMRIVHRDIKPENILLDEGGKAVLIDLSIAKHLDRTTVTQYGYTLGTRGYMSPEQARARQALTQKSDVFALGVVIVESLTGHHPFSFNQRCIAVEPPRGLEEVKARDAVLGQLAERMVATSPVRRPLASDVLAAIPEPSREASIVSAEPPFQLGN